MSQKTHDIPSSVFRNSLIPRVVTIIKAENHWINNKVRSQVGDAIYSGSQIAHFLLDQVADCLQADPFSAIVQADTLQKIQVLMKISTNDQTNTDTLKELQTSRIKVSLLKTGLIEVVDLLLHILSKNYSEVYRVLATQKASKNNAEQLGRLRDSDYAWLCAGYVYIASTFFQTFSVGAKCSQSQKRYFSALYGLFQRELGLTRKVVEEGLHSSQSSHL
jgi:hypothetical protein